MPIRHTLQRHILVIGSIVVVAGLIAASDTLHGQTEQIIVWIEALISRFPVLGMLVFILLGIGMILASAFVFQLYRRLAART